MSYIYTFDNAEETTIKREDDQGQITLIGVNSGSPGWNEYISSGTTAAAYVEPPAPLEPTPEEKLVNAGLTVDELKKLLGLNS